MLPYIKGHFSHFETAAKDVTRAGGAGINRESRL